LIVAPEDKRIGHDILIPPKGQGNAKLGQVVSVEIIDYPSTYPADEPNRRCPDISRISNDLNFEPKISIEEGLIRFFKWTKDNYTSEILK
jgi:nucleoside-diphosphate-sugar epimerase